MHSSHWTEIFLHTNSTSSTPIIEGCTDIAFGPYILPTSTQEESDSEEVTKLPQVGSLQSSLEERCRVT